MQSCFIILFEHKAARGLQLFPNQDWIHKKDGHEVISPRANIGQAFSGAVEIFLFCAPLFYATSALSISLGGGTSMLAVGAF